MSITLSQQIINDSYWNKESNDLIKYQVLDGMTVTLKCEIWKQFQFLGLNHPCR